MKDFLKEIERICLDFNCPRLLLDVTDMVISWKREKVKTKVNLSKVKVVHSLNLALCKCILRFPFLISQVSCNISLNQDSV